MVEIHKGVNQCLAPVPDIATASKKNKLRPTHSKNMSLLITSVPQIYSNPDLSGKSGGNRNNLMLRNWLSMSYTFIFLFRFCLSIEPSRQQQSLKAYNYSMRPISPYYLISRILSIQPLSLMKMSCNAGMGRERLQQLRYKRALSCYQSAL